MAEKTIKLDIGTIYKKNLNSCYYDIKSTGSAKR